MVMPKKTQGRQKVEMKELNGNQRQVTFSKRRAGLFKKAGELSVLSGAEIAVIVISKKDKVYCFGHPDVETILNRYLTGGDDATLAESSQKHVAVNEFNMQYDEAQRELAMEKNRLKEIEEDVKMKKMTGSGGFWWDNPLDENMGLEEMQHYLWSLQEARKKVAAKLDERMSMRMGKSSLMSSMDMKVDVGNNNFVNPILNGGNNYDGVFDSHGYGFELGQY